MTTSGKTVALGVGALLAAGMGFVRPRAALAHDVPGAESASTTTGTTELSSSGARSGFPDAAKVPVRWHGSTLLFDQSATTQTLHVGSDYQSANPTYEWWLALKPRYFIYERDADALSVNLWMNLYLELTNSDTTTRSHEPVVGPSYLWATYARTLRNVRGYKTVVTVGPRATLPTDKAARNAGQIIGLGASGGVSQSFPLLANRANRSGAGAGTGLRALSGARLGLNVIFNHPFARATSGVNDGIHQLRQDVAGRTIASDQLTGSMNVRNAVNVAFTGELQVVRRLELSLSYVLLNSWAYAPPVTCIVTLTDPCAVPTAVADPATFRVSTWATAALNYDLLDELAVGVGYYNLSSQIGPDGTRRNPLWSPAARVFLTLTGNLDVIYQRVVANRRADQTLATRR